METSHASTVPGSGEPIAIVGMSSRFADSEGLEEFWTQLMSSTDGIREIPGSRFNVDAVYDPIPQTPGKTISRWMGAVARVDEFDAEFFGVSPKEAQRMDPQQRLLLEVAYEGLEDAGVPLEDIAGTNGGVFVGQITADYYQMQHANPKQLDFYSMTGSYARAITSGRLSYAFDLRGPSITVDAACSSSLVAVHNAVQALRLGECNLALAGGVNLVLLPDDGIVYSSADMLSGSGRCKFGDASGDGFVRSDGFGMVVLKRLADAVADGDRIYAVIAGTAVGNDGASSGYLVSPSVEGQVQVIRRAFADAGLDPQTVSYVEAHGTGTVAGDPVEIEALSAALDGPARTGSCVVGSVKTNIGHAEAAAGVAGLIKAALVVKNRIVPPNLHFFQPNPQIDWENVPVRLPTEPTTLKSTEPLVAGVSSFGFSGTNAHVVLTAPPETILESPEEQPKQSQLLCISALTTPALHATAALYAERLSHVSAPDEWRDICYSTGRGRSTLDARLALVADSAAEAAHSLSSFANGDEAEFYISPEEPTKEPRTVFVFPGQGSQWIGMGRELLGEESVFADALKRCDDAVQAETGWSILDLLLSDDPDIYAAVDVVQPILWAVEIAIAELWRSWGVEPDIIVGHSMGEVAGACISGILSLEDGAKIICRRSSLVKRQSGRGGMAFVALGEEDLGDLLTDYEDKVSIAASNSPRSTLLAGSTDGLAAVVARAEDHDIFTSLINVDYASHCHYVDEIIPDLTAALSDLNPREGTVRFQSTVTTAAERGDTLDAQYWADNLRQPVQFAKTMEEILAETASAVHIIEMSPHPILLSSLNECVRGRRGEITVVGSLKREESERHQLLESLAELAIDGARPNWAQVTGGRQLVDLPTYPWQREQFWLPDSRRADSATTADVTAPVAESNGSSLAQNGLESETTVNDSGSSRHPMLGQAAPTESADGWVWQTTVDRNRIAYVEDHRVQGVIILPGTAFIELFASVGRWAWGDVPLRVENVHFHAALFLDEEPNEQSIEIRTHATDTSSGIEVQTFSRSMDKEDWTLHCEGLVRRSTATTTDDRLDIDAIRPRLSTEQSAQDFYTTSERNGNTWAGAFRGVSRVWRGSEEALTEITTPAQVRAERDTYIFHPALLDAAGHSMVAARADIVSSKDNVFVLGGLGSVEFLRSSSNLMYSHCQLIPSPREDSFSANINVYDERGCLAARVIGLRLQYLSGHQPTTDTRTPDPKSASSTLNNRASWAELDAPATDWVHKLGWMPTEIAARPLNSGRWVLLADAGVMSRRLKNELEARQCDVIVVRSGGNFVAGTESFRLVPSSAEQHSQMWNEILREGPVAGVIHAWSLDATLRDDSVPAELSRGQALACDSLMLTVQQMEHHSDLASTPLYVITRNSVAAPSDPVRNPFGALAWGLTRTIESEMNARPVTLIDTDAHTESVDLIVGALRPDLEESQLCLRDGKTWAARLKRTPKLVDGSATSSNPLEPHADCVGDHGPAGTMKQVLTTPIPGVLRDLQLVSQHLDEPNDDEVLVEVDHACVNYRDVLIAGGMYPGQDMGQPSLGWDFSGTIAVVGSNVKNLRPGDCVFGLAPGALASHVIANARAVAKRPDQLSSANAATLASAYVTAYHSLVDIARLRAEDNVLVHSATGGTGMACLNVAMWLGAKIWATAGSPDKRDYLKRSGVADVGDSRSLEFESQFRKSTQGYGFDIIVNTLAGEAVDANLRLLHSTGRYVELSKRDIVEGRPLDRKLLDGNRLFASVDLTELLALDPAHVGEILYRVVESVAAGELASLPITVFPADQAADAFLLMGRSRHIGRVVVDFTGVGGSAHLTSDEHYSVPSIKAFDESSSEVDFQRGTALVVGGLGGIGKELAEWLVRSGSRSLLLTGRRPIEEVPDGLATLDRLRALDAQVEYAQVDIADVAAMRRLLERRRATGTPEIHHAFHLAGTIDYVPVSELDSRTLRDTLKPKVFGAWAIHQVLGGLPIESFVLFSSGSAELSSPLLGGYAAGNAFLDALSHYRRSKGLPATSINWGFWGSVGMVARQQQEQGDRTHVPTGMYTFDPHDAFPLMQRIIASGTPQAAVLRADWDIWARTYPSAAKVPLLRDLVNAATDNAEPPGLTQSPEPVQPVSAAPPQSAPAASAPVSAEALLEADLSAEKHDKEEVLEFLRAEVADVLGLEPERVKASRPLSRMGMDSMMAVELQNRVQREFGVKLPVVQMLKDSSVTDIADALMAGGMESGATLSTHNGEV